MPLQLPARGNVPTMMFGPTRGEYFVLKRCASTRFVRATLFCPPSTVFNSRQTHLSRAFVVLCS